MLLGFALIVQLQHGTTDSFNTWRDSDLVGYLDDLSNRSQRLERQADELTKTRDELVSSSDRQSAAQAAAQERADMLAILAGTVPATGEGVVLTIVDPQDQLKPTTFVDIVQELRGAGAEAIQVGDVRVIASTSFVQGDNGGIKVDGTTLNSPYVFKVVGTAHTLAPAMRIPGGVIATVQALGSHAKATLEERRPVLVDAIKPAPTLNYAKPIDPSPGGHG